MLLSGNSTKVPYLPTLLSASFGKSFFVVFFLPGALHRINKFANFCYGLT